MTTAHYLNTAGQPVGVDEINQRDDVSCVVFDGSFEQRWVVDVDGGTVSCQRCGPDCEHESQVQGMLEEDGLIQ